MLNQGATAVSPSWTWGSSAELVVTAQQPAFTPSISQQLAQVALPEPALCSIYFQASVTSDSPLDTVRVFTLNLSQGIGRVTVPRQISFPFQPAVGAPLEFTIPFVPLHALQVDCEAAFDTLSLTPNMRVQVYMVLAPLTRIAQKQQKLDFGMATPGEADSLDDELSENLEAEAPTVAQIMNAEAQQRLDGEDGDDDDDEDDDEEEEPEVRRAPSWLLRVVSHFSQRHGRPPTRAELRQAVVRMRQRAARRGARG